MSSEDTTELSDLDVDELVLDSIEALELHGVAIEAGAAELHVVSSRRSTISIARVILTTHMS